MEGRVLFLEALHGLLKVLQLVCALGRKRHTHDGLRDLDTGHGQADAAVSEGVTGRALNAKQRNDVTSRLRAAVLKQQTMRGRISGRMVRCTVMKNVHLLSMQR